MSLVASPAMSGAFLRICAAAASQLMALSLVLGLGVFALTPRATLAQELLPVPALTGALMDQANALSASDKTALNAQLTGLTQQRGSQVVLLLVPSTLSEPIADYANRVASTWRIGRKGVGDGVLIVAAIQDRKVRIEVARTLEGAIPDVTAKRIIREAIAPAFAQGQFAKGLAAALHRIDERLASEHLPEPELSASADVDLTQVFPLLIGGVFAGLVLRSMLGRIGAVIAGLGASLVVWNMGVALVMAAVAGVFVWVLCLILGLGDLIGVGSSSARRSGGGFGSGGFSNGGSGGFSNGGGGGFSSGGGGDFGGGGASGDW